MHVFGEVWGILHVVETAGYFRWQLYHGHDLSGGAAGKGLFAIMGKARHIHLETMQMAQGIMARTTLREPFLAWTGGNAGRARARAWRDHVEKPALVQAIHAGLMARAK